MKIAFFDLETTGTDLEKDRIVEIAIIVVDGNERHEYRSLVNPLRNIPEESTKVHGITNEMVKDAPAFSEISIEVCDLMKGCAIGGFNSNRFDIPFIANEFSRAGIEFDFDNVPFIDVCTIYKRQEERTLSAAVKFYLGKEHEDAHNALADVNATIDVYNAQLEKHDLPKDLNELNLYCNYDNERADISGNFKIDNGKYFFNFGKHKGKEARKEISYLRWMLGQNFMHDTKRIIKKIIGGK